MLKFVEKFQEYACAVMLFFVVALAFANVIVRYLTNASLAFTEELIINLFVWLTVFGGAIAFKRKAHLAVTALTNLFPPKLQKAAVVFSALCSTALFILLLYHGYNLVVQEYVNKMTTYSMALPMWWFGLALPFGAVLLIISVVQATLEELRLLAEKEQANG
ncbi:MAG TPA: TRAP transporter small permease [Firmicutes bacterium]|nr:TRAP transporter small permease [Bacillota bacterium]